ncbi:FMN-dependent dehydrogenase, partial [Aureobasidium melanogenum]
MESLLDNEQAYRRYKIRPRILVDVEKLDMSTEIFGVKVPFPLGFSPSAMHKLAHPEGEVATSRAAASQGICMGLSSYSTTSLEDVAAQGEGNPYFVQICVLKDRRTTLQLLKRAEKAGYKAVFVSVDVPVLGRRLNEMRNNFILPEEMEFPNILSSGKAEFSGENEATAYDASLKWDTAIPWLKANTNMQIWLKGVNTAEDVALAIQHGLDGIVISNHGGRQLDGVPATLDTLRECAPIAKGRISIAVDGGIRQGSDIFKALALEAEHCFVGRIPIWGLAYKGQEGVELGIKILLQEFAITMRLAGHASYAVLHAVLAVMSFHMDRLNTTEPRVGYWWALGEDYMSQAVTQVKLLLADIPIAVDITCYKSTVMALLTMVALTSGKLEETRIYLLDTQKFIKQHASPEKQKSRKIQLLHALFVYLRVLEESTYIYPISFERSLSNNRSHIYSVTKFPSLAIKDLSDPLHTPQRPSFEELIVPDFCFEAPNNAMRRMFAHMLCLPESLLVLMSHITFVACEARQSRDDSQTIDASIKQDFDDRVKVIEDLLCAWTFQNDRLNWVTADSIEDSPRSDGRDDVLEHIATAFHSALLLYFYREVKQINRLVLQPLVKKITTHLIDCENSKQQNNVPSNSVIWPGFMAAIEALEEEDFAQVIGWMRSCADRYSLRAFDRAITAATELRTLRVHTGTDSWPDTMLQKGIFLVLS